MKKLISILLLALAPVAMAQRGGSAANQKNTWPVCSSADEVKVTAGSGNCPAENYFCLSNSGDTYKCKDRVWTKVATPTGSGGSSVVLDVGDDDTNESTGATEIATTGDSTSIVTVVGNKLLFDMSKKWPIADTGDSATSFFSSGTIDEARIDSGITRDSEWPSATGTFTNKTFDMGGTGNKFSVVDLADCTIGFGNAQDGSLCWDDTEKGASASALYVCNDNAGDGCDPGDWVSVGIGGTVDISDDTNLAVAGSGNLTLTDDTLDVADKFLKNSEDDTMAGDLTIDDSDTGITLLSRCDTTGSSNVCVTASTTQTASSDITFFQARENDTTGSGGTLLFEVDYTGRVYAKGGFESEPAATPAYNFRDSDMGGTEDNNAQIRANCPTGSTAGGDEDCDLEIGVQAAGTLDYVFKLDTNDSGDVTIQMGDPGTNYVNVDEAGAMTAVGSASITATDVQCSSDCIAGSEITDGTVDSGDVASGAIDGSHLSFKHFESVTLETPADADSFLLFKAPYAITITNINCIVDPADTSESVAITVQECDSNGDTCGTTEAITCANTNTADNGTIDDGAIDANDWVNLDIGTVTGTVTQLSVTILYTVD